MTQDLADLAQADAQQLKCYLSSVNPWEVVLQEVENFKPKLEQAGLEIQVEGTSSPLLLDRDRFKQIIVNLISNSIRYTETGGKIHIHTSQTPQSGRYMSMIVLISDEQLSRLGERVSIAMIRVRVVQVEQGWA